MWRVGERVLVVNWLRLSGSETRPGGRREATVVEDCTKEKHAPMFLVRSRGEERVVPAEWLQRV